MKKTAEEILKEHFFTRQDPEVDIDHLIKIMEEYAKQENQPSEQISVERMVSQRAELIDKINKIDLIAHAIKMSAKITEAQIIEIRQLCDIRFCETDVTSG